MTIRSHLTAGKILVAATILGVSGASKSEELSAESLFDLSLEQLLQVKVETGQLRSVRSQQSPSAITVIQRNQIELSSAKNIAEVLELYVPGLMIFAHSEGDKIALRGHIAAENYKLLLLVNGKNITNMVYEGPITELDQWDLSDIDKIEVVRGPGSVVYGTGAIAGVINIITKSPTSNSGNEFTFSHVDQYNSRGFSIQGANAFGDWSSYYFASYRSTNGLKDPDYYLTTNAGYRDDPATQPIDDPSDNRHVGERPGDTHGPQAYLADSFGRPQIKLHASLQFKDTFKMFTRYTQSGQQHHFRPEAPVLNSDGETIGSKPDRTVSLRSLILAPEYVHRINKNSKITSSITFDSQEYLRHEFNNPIWPEDHYNNIREYAFSQNRWVAQSLYSYENDSWDITAGYEYSTINVAAPWWEDEDRILIREGVYLISDDDTSDYSQDPSLERRPVNPTEEIGNGLDFQTHSNLLESNLKINQHLTLHYAHRWDFPDVSSSMYAPRLSIIATPSKRQAITATAQRALRMMPLRAQYLVDKNPELNNSNKEHEKIDSFEFAYTNNLNKKSYLTARTFYNEIDAVGYTGRELRFLGSFSLLGFELEGTYKSGSYELLVNHSYLKTTDFEMSEDLKREGTNRNNISYSDYFYRSRGDVAIPLESYGDGLNNWSENTSKLIFTKSFFSNALKFQANLQIFWDYDGAYDEVRMYEQAYDNYDTSTLTAEELNSFNEQRRIFEREKELLEKDNAYETQYNLGGSISYRRNLSKDASATVSLFAQNLLSTRYRYYVNTGSSSYYPNRLNYMKEPKVFGFKAKLNY